MWRTENGPLGLQGWRRAVVQLSPGVGSGHWVENGTTGVLSSRSWSYRRDAAKAARRGRNTLTSSCLFCRYLLLAKRSLKPAGKRTCSLQAEGVSLSVIQSQQGRIRDAYEGKQVQNRSIQPQEAFYNKKLMKSKADLTKSNASVTYMKAKHQLWQWMEPD